MLPKLQYSIRLPYLELLQISHGFVIKAVDFAENEEAAEENRKQSQSGENCGQASNVLPRHHIG